MKPGSKFLHSLFEVAHVEFQAYDLSNHKVAFSSGVVRQLLGYSADEYASLSNHFYKSIIHTDDYEKVLQTIDKLVQSKNGEVVEMTVRLRKNDDAYVWLYSRQMIYERNEAENKLTIIREVEDVTKLIQLQNELEQKVEQLKTVSFKNSHLLRSPVASIIGLVDLIEEDGITNQHNKQVFHYLKETIAKLDDVVRDINDVARPG